MRPKILLTLLFAVLVQFCFGQEYHKIVDTNKVWSIIDEYTAGGGQPYSQFIKFTTDTLIGSYNYKKVLRSSDSTQTVWSHIGFIREDSTAKVYYMNNSYLEGLIYDFNVNINDTINIYNPLVCFDSSNMVCIVEQIDSIFIYNNYRKQIHILSAFGSEVWIEGIGSNRGILYTNQCIVGNLFKLLCFYENDTLLYQNPLYPYCYYPTNTNDYLDNKTKKEFIIYPNPAYNKIYVECDTKLENIYLEIYNIWGQIEKKLKINNEVIYLDESLKDGLYFCILKDESNNILAKTKLIINKTY